MIERGSLAWVVPEADGAERAIGHRAELARLIDDFVRIGRPASSRRQQKAALAFSREWGPWGNCSCGGYHGAIRPGMRPSSAAAMPKPPGWAPRRDNDEPIDAVVGSARRLNAWRAIVAKAWADPGAAPEPWSVFAALQGLTVRPPSAADVFASGLAGAGAKATIARWVQDWLRACHVAPLVGAGYLLEVGGSAGALAVAMLYELSVAPHVAICSNLDCMTTETVRRDWDPTIVTGRDPENPMTMAQGRRCSPCREKDRKAAQRSAA